MSLFGSETTTKPKMFGPAKDLMKDVLKDANKSFNKGGTYAYTGSMVTPFADQTKDAFGGLTTLANNNSGGKGLSGQMQSIIDNGGFNAGQLQTMGDMRGLIDNKGMNDLINGDGLTADQRLVADRYRTGMNEQFGTDANYNRVKQDALDEQRMALEAQASKMGRFGGGASQTILANRQGSLAASMDTGELDKFRARTDKAAGDLAGLSGVGVGQQGAAMDRKAGLASGLFNMNQAGLNNMSQAYQAAQQPALTQRAVGAEYENLMSRQLADQKRIHDELDPMKRYQQYMALASGAPQGSTQTTDPSLLSTLFGGGLGVLALGGMMGGGWGGASAPAGAGAGTF